MLNPLPPTHVCFLYPFVKLHAWGHTTHVLHVISTYTEVTQLAQTFASFLASSKNMWTVLSFFDIFVLKSIQQRGRDSTGWRGTFPDWQARKSALCLLPVNRQEGILSLCPRQDIGSPLVILDAPWHLLSQTSLMSLSTVHEAPNYSLLSPGNTSLSSVLCHSDTASRVT